MEDTTGVNGITATIPTIPSELPYIPTGTGSNQRPIQEITPPGGTNDITSQLQSAITAAGVHAGKRPIIHIPDGSFKISQTILIPANLDVQIVGEGFSYSTWLDWTGTGPGPVFQLNGPSKATFRDLNISGGANGAYLGADGILIGATNTNGEKISLEQASYSNLLATGLPNTLIEMHNCYSGGAKDVALKADNSRINLFGGLITSSNLTFDVTNAGKIMAQDFWYETGAHFGTGPKFLNLAGNGSISLENFHTSPVTTASSPAIIVDGFSGRLNLLGMSGIPGYSSEPFKTIVTNNSTGALSMVVMGSTADTPTWFVNNSTSANIGFFSNKGGGQRITDFRTGSASSDEAMINSALSQSRSERATLWPLPAPSLSGSSSDVRISRVRITNGPVNIKIAYSNTTGPTPTPTPSPTATPTPPVNGNGTGLTGQYYNDKTLSTLVKTQIDPKVDFTWTGSPKNLDNTTMASIGADNFSVRWTGQVQAVEAGAYSFRTLSDDGVRLWLTNLDGTPVINNWTDHAPATDTTANTITLTAGQKINIKMEFYESAGGAEAHLSWQRPGQGSFSIVPQSQLYPTTVTTVSLSTRFYPRSGGNYRIFGGVFKGSNNNSTWNTLGNVTTVPNDNAWTQLSLGATLYRYYRYDSPTGSYGNIAELEFYNGTTKLTGTTFGTSGSWANDITHTYSAAFDGNTSTYFDAATADGNVMGLDTGP